MSSQSVELLPSWSKDGSRKKKTLFFGEVDLTVELIELIHFKLIELIHPELIERNLTNRTALLPKIVRVR